MEKREKRPSSNDRFDSLWETVTSGGEDTTGELGSFHGRTVSNEDGTKTGVMVRAHTIPYVEGSLRPQVRTLEIMSIDGKPLSLSDVQTAFHSTDRGIVSKLKTLEVILLGAS